MTVAQQFKGRVKTRVPSAEGAKCRFHSRNVIIARFQRSGRRPGLHLGRWPKLLHFRAFGAPGILTQAQRSVGYYHSCAHAD